MSSKYASPRCLVIVLSPILTFLLVFAAMSTSFSQPVEEMKRIADEKKKEEQRRGREKKEEMKRLYEDAVSHYNVREYSEAKELFEKVRDSEVDLGFFETIKLKDYLKRIDKDIEDRNKKRAELRGVYSEGKKLLDAGDYDGAMKKFSQVLSSGIGLGDRLNKELSKNVSEVEKKLEESRKSARQKGKAAREAAREDVEGRADRLEEAVGLLERLREEGKIRRMKNLKEAQMSYQIARKLYVERDYRKALTKLEDALQKNPDHVEAKRLHDEISGLLGVAPYRPKMLQDRLENETAVRIRSDVVQVENSLRESKALMGRGEYEAAIKKLERAQRKLGFLELHVDVSVYKNVVADMIKDANAKRTEQVRQEEAERQRIALEEAAGEQKRLEQLEEDKIDKLFQRVVMKFQQERFDEAIKAAKDILQIEPDNGPAKSMIESAKKANLKKKSEDVEKEDGDRFEAFKQDLKESAIPPTKDLTYPDTETWNKIKQREHVLLPSEEEEKQMLEENLQSALQKKVSFNFDGTPLPEALEVLADEAGTNLIMGHEASEIGMSQFVNFETRKKMTLRSALETILPKEMSYCLRDEAIRVDLRDRIKSEQKLVFRAYDVTNLLLVTDDYGSPEPRVKVNLVGKSGPLAAPILEESPRATDRPTRSATGDSHSATTSERFRLAQRGLSDSDTVKRRGRELIDLIIKMTGRENWRDYAVYSERQDGHLSLSGGGTQEFGGGGGGGEEEKEEFGLGTVGIKDGDLIVQQTAQLHESIEEILKGLRSARYIQVSVQARFLTVTDSFMEEIGTSIPSASTFFGDKPANATSVLANPGLNTPNAIPLVDTGAAAAAALAAEGLNMVFSFVDKNQVEAIMKLAQASNKAKVLTAPRITCFNAQRASLIVGSQTNFVLTFTSASVGGTGGAAGAGGGTALVPQIAAAPNSVALDVRPIVSADRRYVYLELQPAISQLEELKNFPIQTFVPFVNPEGRTIFITQDIPIQLPVFSTRGVGTTVCVPDRGTVLFGGLAAYSESAKESGPPILAKIPIINFFFSRHSKEIQRSNLLIMVTPHIMLPEEEEEDL